MTDTETLPPLPLGLHDLPLHNLCESEENPREINPDALDRLKYSLREDPAMLKARPIIATSAGEVVCGNMRLRAMQEMGWENAPVFVEDLDEDRKREWMLRDNQEYGDWVPDELAALIARHAAQDGDMQLLGFAEEEITELLDRANADLDGVGGPGARPSLAERFGVAPFTVLDARSHIWLDRKREWVGLGIHGELGRTAKARQGIEIQDPKFYERKADKEREVGHALTTAEYLRDHHTAPEDQYAATGTSIFDPVVCELTYKWYSAPGSVVLDPFAGGSVRGIVAAHMGREYVGFDLSEEQVEANRANAEDVLAEHVVRPAWVVGDAVEATTYGDTKADLIFTCPPYHDLEQYSDDPRDLSNAKTYGDFYLLLDAVVKNAAEVLRDDRFAVFVVGDVRDTKTGIQNPIVADLITVCRKHHLMPYNHAILVQPVGSLRIRAAHSFVATRKLGMTHQHVLTFVKGDPRYATANCESIGEDDIPQDADEA